MQPERLDVYRITRNNEWFNEECMEILNKNNYARLKIPNREIRQSYQKYRKLKKKAKSS